MSVRANELVASLVTTPDMPAPKVVDEIYALGDAAVPALRELVRKYPTRPEPDWPVDVAVGLLGDLDAGDAFEDLRNLLRKARMETAETIGDALRKLTAVPAADFLGMLRDTTFDWSQRCVALDGLCGVMIHRHGEADEIEDALEAYMTEMARRAKSLSDDDARVACMIALTLAQRGAARHRPAIEAAFKAGLKSDMISEKDVREVFENEEDDADEEQDAYADSYRGRYRDLYRPSGKRAAEAPSASMSAVHAAPSPDGEPATFTGSSEEPERGSGEAPITREKIGRNDPCPCGSGKKYKKCCGK